MMRSVLALLVATLATPAWAQVIYKCTDTNGNTVISNNKLEKNCKAVVSGPESYMPAPKLKPLGAATNPTPASFPKVQDETQRARDGDRRHILEQELAAEQRNVEQARRELVEQERVSAANPERVAPYKDSVAQHERNIQAIQKELSNLH